MTDIVRNAYESLAEEFDVIVIEGAGSPSDGAPAQEMSLVETNGVIIGNASVTMNGTSMSFNATNSVYIGSTKIPANTSTAVNVTIKGCTCTALVIQSATCPAITASTNGILWGTNTVDTISWIGGTLTSGASYGVIVLASNISSTPLFDKTAIGPKETPVTTTSVNVPVSPWTNITSLPLPLILAAGIMTSEINNFTNRISFSNTSSNAYLYLGIFSSNLIVLAN